MHKGFGEAIADALNKLRSSELTLEHRLYSFKFTVVEIAFGIRVRIEDTSRTKWPVAFCDIRGDTEDICSRFPTHLSGLMRGYEILPGATNQHGNCCPRPTIQSSYIVWSRKDAGLLANLNDSFAKIPPLQHPDKTLNSILKSIRHILLIRNLPLANPLLDVPQKVLPSDIFKFYVMQQLWGVHHLGDRA